MSIIPDALAYYDKISANYKPLFRKVVSYKLNMTFDPKIPNTIDFFNKDGKIIGNSVYQSLGVYSAQHRLWVWAWGSINP
jgi:hypothetical protein